MKEVIYGKDDSDINPILQNSYVIEMEYNRVSILFSEVDGSYVSFSKKGLTRFIDELTQLRDQLED